MLCCCLNVIFVLQVFYYSNYLLASYTLYISSENVFNFLLCYFVAMKDEEGKTLWLDNQSHASSSVSSSDDDVSWQWPTSFWTQFKV
jgi:hypothetical protein